MQLSRYLMQEYIFFMDQNKFKWILNDLNYTKKILILKLIMITIYQKEIKRSINQNKEASKIEDAMVRKDIEIMKTQDKIEYQDKIGGLDKIDH